MASGPRTSSSGLSAGYTIARVLRKLILVLEEDSVEHPEEGVVKLRASSPQQIAQFWNTNSRNQPGE